MSIAEVLVIARALGQPPGALVFPAGYASEVEYLPEKKTDPLKALDWWNGESLPPDARVTFREGAATRTVYPEGSNQQYHWAVNIARKHRDIVNQIRTHYRNAWESEILEKTGAEPDNSSVVAREVAKHLEYHLYDIREEMTRLGLVVPELPPGMKITKRPSEKVHSDEDGNIVGYWTQHGPPPF